VQYRRQAFGALGRDHGGSVCGCPSTGCAPSHRGFAHPDGGRLVEDDFAAATAAFLNQLGLGES
jgi:hypothetical protein